MTREELAVVVSKVEFSNEAVAFDHAIKIADRILAALAAEKTEYDLTCILPQKYKCPKCHTKFTRVYPYKPSDTKEIKDKL